MYRKIVAVALLSAPALAWSPLAERQTSSDEELYLNSVCLPNVTDPIPPCQEIINIQQECATNGTSSLALLAHAQCMCGGSFFADWIGCLTCNYIHGARSEQTFEAFNTIITSASNALCTGTPTADFTAIFNSISNSGGGAAATGATSLIDQYPSNSAVSLYYTATGAQGAGAITGSATLATASVTSTSATTRSTGTTATRVSTTGATSGSATGDAASTSSSAAAPTGAALNNFMAVVAGGAAVVAAAL